MAAAYDLYSGTVMKDPPLLNVAQFSGIVDVVGRANDKAKSVDLGEAHRQLVRAERPGPRPAEVA